MFWLTTRVIVGMCRQKERRSGNYSQLVAEVWAISGPDPRKICPRSVLVMADSIADYECACL